MLFGVTLDFTDEFSIFDHLFLIGAKYPYHETIEDILGAIGFLLFTLGIGFEIKFIRKENLKKEKMVQTLQKQAQRLKELDQIKSSFVSTVSHELRTPLVVIGGAIHNILMGTTGKINDKLRKYLEMTDSNIKRLDRLVTELLDYSRMERGVLKIKKHPIDICHLTHQVISSLKPQLTSEKITISTDFCMKPLIWNLDENRITQVLTNLIHNAFKFTPRGGGIKIIIKYKENKNKLQITVSDTGRGIAQEDIPKLFKDFVQIKRKEGASAQGTGLGLAISKGIIEAHQGTIHVESILNKGSKFVFTLPKKLL